ncbi:hypothetical protein PR048_028606 [Dryococelus australis]|uniref:Uncharacterized protein n=1 Tax=Dryococelus australis TaxID=614101 RepID=A0ABQ9GB20_9NEOP|nr:hypothetical protein PR048_028606 [Dryococelus australis]
MLSGTTITINHLKLHPVEYTNYQSQQAKKPKVATVSPNTTNQSHTQPTISSFVQQLKWEHSHISAKKLTDNIGNFIVKDLHPYSIVYESGFRDMMEEAQPRYAVPNLTTFSRNIVPKLYENCKSRVKELLDNDMQDIQSVIYNGCMDFKSSKRMCQ